MNYKIKGYTLIDLTVSITLGALILVGVSPAISTILTQQKRLQTHTDELRKSARIFSFFTKIIQEIDYTPFNLSPYVEKWQEKRSDLGVRLMRGKFSPRRGSDMITAFEPYITNPLHITSIEENTFEVCFKDPSLNIPEPYINLAGVSEYGYSIYFLLRYAKISSRPCYRLFTAPCSSFPMPVINPILFIPLKRVYTLYTDKYDTLRFITHECNAIVENQPIMKDAPVLRITKHQILNNYVLSLRFKSMKIYSGNFQQTIMRHDRLSYLLNQW